MEEGPAGTHGVRRVLDTLDGFRASFVVLGQRDAVLLASSRPRSASSSRFGDCWGSRPRQATLGARARVIYGEGAG
jgi:hypothetical protein